MRDRKNGMGRQAVLAAVLAGALSMGTVSADALAFNFGPGMEDHEVIIYNGQTANNPAYDNGWSGGAGPGEVGNNPMGNQGQTEEEALSGGPNSEAAKNTWRIRNVPSTYSAPTGEGPGKSWRMGNGGCWHLTGSLFPASGAMWTGKRICWTCTGSCRRAGRWSMENGII